ncbi:MAG: hypothetical protein HC904_13805, partial [Blastochloris sp.]|nr:hypothetical protein [Blastochloris sp.]
MKTTEELKREVEAIRQMQHRLVEELRGLGRRLDRVTESLDEVRRAEVREEAKVEVVEKPEELVLPPPLPLPRVPTVGLKRLDVPALPSVRGEVENFKLPVKKVGPEEGKAEPEAERGGGGESFEFKLGQVWLVRIAVLLVLTALVLAGNLAYHFVIEQMSPLWKALGLYLCSVGMMALGFFLESRGKVKASLRPFGQVILSGGMAAVYYTTYASHFVPALRWLDSLTMTSLLLLGWAGVMVWLADTKKSQILGGFSLLLAYYSCVIGPLTWFTLLSNLLLAGAALVLLFRNGWSLCSWLALPATYGAFTYWHWLREGEAGMGTFWLSAGFLSLYWVLFTVSTLFSREKGMGDEEKAVFSSLNHFAYYGLMMMVWPRAWESGIWLGLGGFGLVLLALGLGIQRRWKGNPVLAGATLLQGLLFLTAGLFFKFSGKELSMLLLVQSGTLLLAARGGWSVFFRVLGAGWALLAVGVGAEGWCEMKTSELASGGFAVLVLLAQSWWSQRRSGLGESFYYATLGVLVGIVLSLVHGSRTVEAPMMAVIGLSLGWVGARLRWPGLAELGPLFLWVGLGAWFWEGYAGQLPWWNLVITTGACLGLSFWWEGRREGASAEERGWRELGIFFLALGSVLMVLLWVEARWSGQDWMMWGGLLVWAGVLL